MPEIRILYAIFESNAQITGKEGILIIKKILDVISQYPVKRIFTFAAFAQTMSYQDETQVLVTCNIPQLLNELEGRGLAPMPDGFIAGLNGLLLGVAASRQIESACFLGTIPGYAINLNYPKASLELINAIASILNIEIDIAEIIEGIDAIAQQFAMIEERIREFAPNVSKENDEEIAEIEDEQVL